MKKQSIILIIISISFVFITAFTPLWAGTTERVSVSSDGTQGNNGSLLSSISADGRYVAFYSSSSNLVPGDTNGKTDVFVRDRQTGKTERVSVSSDGTQGNDWSQNPSISADGRYVVFDSYADNLVPGDTNGKGDIFVRDRQTGKTERVSVSSDGTQGNEDSDGQSISADGRYVAFDSFASNLVPGDYYGSGDIFVRDRQTGKTERVSVPFDGAQLSGYSGDPYISADGRYVAFGSVELSLVPGDTNGTGDVFVRDRQTGKTEMVSVSSDGSQGNSNSYGISISADGRYVAFESNASNLVPGDTNHEPDVYVRDRQTGKTERISVSSDGIQGNDRSQYPSISADGRYVAFESNASNLVPGDTNHEPDVYVRDRQTGKTELVSVSSDGTQGDVYSQIPSISADGRYVAFTSWASNLVPGDTNGHNDTFVRDRIGSAQYPESTLINISGFTFSPGQLSKTTDVTVKIAASGAVSGRLRISGIFRNHPDIPLVWNGTAWTCKISSAIAYWTVLNCLYVTADLYDNQGRKRTQTKTLTVVRTTPPVAGSGVPNSIWIDESLGCGILVGESKILDVTATGLKAKLGIDTEITGILGVSGSMNIWPHVQPVGPSLTPVQGTSTEAVLAKFDRISPSGGPAYNCIFTKAGQKAYFPVEIDTPAYFLTLWDTLAVSISTLSGIPDLSASSILETYGAFSELAPVKNAIGRFPGKPTGSNLIGAIGLATWDLSEFARNEYERETLKAVIQLAVRKSTGKSTWSIKEPGWFKAAGPILSYYSLLKIWRDMIVWGVATWDQAPSVIYESYRNSSGALSIKLAAEEGSSANIREKSMNLGFAAKQLTNGIQYNFTVTNTGTPIWEWRLELDENSPVPISVSSPLGWNGEIVFNNLEHYVRWYTEGPESWASGDFGDDIIPEGGSLGSFKVVFKDKLQFGIYAATDIEMLIDGDIMPAIPDLSAIPADFSPSEGETSMLLVYLERPAKVRLAVYKDGVEYKVLQNLENRAAGSYNITWDGKSSSASIAPSGEYNVKLNINYTDGDKAELAVPVTLKDADSMKTTWNGMAMVSIPVIPKNTDPKEVVGFMGNRWWAFNPLANNYIAYPDTLSYLDPVESTPGRGFWAKFDHEAAVPFGVIKNQDLPATIHLQRGWNMIGSPYLSELQWNADAIQVKATGQTAKSLRNSSDVLARFIWGWKQNETNLATGQYYRVCDPSIQDTGYSALVPWEGYWIRAYKECDLILPSPQSSPPSSTVNKYKLGVE